MAVAWSLGLSGGVCACILERYVHALAGFGCGLDPILWLHVSPFACALHTILYGAVSSAVGGFFFRACAGTGAAVVSVMIRVGRAVRVRAESSRQDLEGNLAEFEKDLLVLLLFAVACTCSCSRGFRVLR